MKKILIALLAGAMVFASCKKDPILVGSITLNQKEASIVEGNSLQLTATVSPADAENKALTWSTDNKDVATVDPTGKVTAVKAGTANIKVVPQDGGKASATCKITVTAKEIKVTEITLSETKLALNTSETRTLTATVKPDDATNKNVTWSSDTPAVATVDATGKVTAVAAGTANIKAKAADGSNVESAACVVTVTAIIPVEKIELPATSGYTYVGSTLKFAYKRVLPETATDKHLVWTTGNAGIATVTEDTGEITGVAAGTTTITATAKDGSGVKAEFALTVKAVPVIPTKYADVVIAACNESDGWGTGKDKSVEPYVVFPFGDSESKGGIIDRTDNLTGTGCYSLTPVSTTASYYNHFHKKFYEKPVDITSIPADGRYLCINLYINDIALIDGGNNANGQIELCSGGDADKKECTFLFSQCGLKSGWNKICLDMNNPASCAGDFDPANINYVRVYYYNAATEDIRNNGQLTMKLDQIKVVYKPNEFCNCDDDYVWKATGLTGTNIWLKGDTAEKTEGTGSICVENAELEGSIAFFRYDLNAAALEPLRFTNPRGLTVNDATVSLDLYVSDATKVNQADGIRFELTSATNDSKGFDFTYDKKDLKAGWNHIEMPFTACHVGDGANMADIRYFRIMFNNVPEGKYTIRIDNIRIF